MNILITLLAIATSTIAQPLLLKYDHPLRGIYDYHYHVHPEIHSYAPVVRHLDPSALPIHLPAIRYELPYVAGIKSIYNEKDIFGQTRYGHIEPGQSHHAIQDIYGNKIGGFSYYNAEGKLKQTSYIADAAGYRVATNDLPVDTKEVTDAKFVHLAEHAKLKSLRKRDLSSFSSFNTPSSFNSPDLRYNQQPTFRHAYPTSNLQPSVTKNGFLEDTPEVLAATADHFARVADSKARIAELQRNSNYDYQNPVDQNTFNPVSHHTTSHQSFQNNYDYRYQHQPQTYQSTSGVPQETPEVLAAKAKHFAELAASKARGATFAEPFHQVQTPRVSNTPVAPPTPSFQPSFDYQYTPRSFPHAYPTTNLKPVVTRDGFLEETPEVLAAKANHFAQLAAAKARALN